MKTKLQNRSGILLHLTKMYTIALFVFIGFQAHAQTPCNANFSYSVNSSTGLVTFTNTSSGTTGTTNYQWYLNGGTPNISNLQNPTSTFPAGSYTICLRITDSLSGTICNDLFCDTIIVNTSSSGPCSANFTYTTNGNTANFTNTSTGGTFPNYTWYMFSGTPNSANTTNSSTTYPGPGTYNVCLFMNDSVGSLCDSICKTVTIGPSSINEQSIIASTLNNFPNPFNGSTTVSYTLKQDAEIELAVFDVLGKKVATIDKGLKTAGKQSIDWNAEGINKGMYMIQLNVNQQTITKKIIITK